MNIKTAFSIFIAIVLVWFLLSKIEVGAIVITLKNMPPHLILLGLFFYALSYLFRAFRFKMLLQGDVSVVRLYNIVAIHNMWLNLLPLRAGELSYLYLLKKKGGAVSYLTGVPSLVLARVFDLLSIFLLFLISFVGLGQLPDLLNQLAILMIVMVLTALVIMALLLWKKERFLGQIKYYILKYKMERIAFVNKMLGKSSEILEGFKSVQDYIVIMKIFIYSLLSWLAINAYNFVIIRALNIDFNVWQILFITIFFIFLSLLPVNGYAGFGTFESVFVVISSSFGVMPDVAIGAAFAAHIVSICIFVLIGLISFLALNFSMSNI